MNLGYKYDQKHTQFLNNRLSADSVQMYLKSINLCYLPIISFLTNYSFCAIIFNILKKKELKKEENLTQTISIIILNDTKFCKHIICRYCHCRSMLGFVEIIIQQNTRRKEMFFLMMHSTHFIYSYMASDIW